MDRVGFWRRTLALMIDGVLVLIAVAIADGFGISKWWADFLRAIVWLLYTLPEIFVGATLGKRLVGIKIANADGTAADRWVLFLRWSTKQLPVLSNAIFLLTSSIAFWWLAGMSNGVLLVGFLYASTEFKQGWHDEWAKTAVFRRKSVPPPIPVTVGIAL